MIISLVRGRRWVPLGALGGLGAAHGAMGVGLLPCPMMSMTQCLAVAVGVVAAASLAAAVARATFLALRTAGAVAALGRVPTPPTVAEAAERAGARDVVCVPGEDRTGFCAGLVRPRVYVTTALSGPELDAVLAHEAAHARRRDPLRRLVSRAAADVLFYLPLAFWWRNRQIERSELFADRAAIDRVARKAVAVALMSADGGRLPETTAAWDGAAQARAAQLLGDDVPRRRPARAQILASASGLTLVVSLSMCLGQAFLLTIGLA
ncbi:M56 family metallopeptidase [Actinomadura sp. 6N118]|uniref:M56 family metallopeptidase n=1 Tax=Actinomadura sp. 6N118 TaxID=3375151 RepID=UPI0037A67D3E